MIEYRDTDYDYGYDVLSPDCTQILYHVDNYQEAVELQKMNPLSIVRYFSLKETVEK